MGKDIGNLGTRLYINKYLRLIVLTCEVSCVSTDTGQNLKVFQKTVTKTEKTQYRLFKNYNKEPKITIKTHGSPLSLTKERHRGHSHYYLAIKLYLLEEDRTVYVSYSLPILHFKNSAVVAAHITNV